MGTKFAIGSVHQISEYVDVTTSLFNQLACGNKTARPPSQTDSCGRVAGRPLRGRKPPQTQHVGKPPLLEYAPHHKLPESKQPGQRAPPNTPYQVRGISGHCSTSMLISESNFFRAHNRFLNRPLTQYTLLWSPFNSVNVLRYTLKDSFVFPNYCSFNFSKQL